MGALFDGYCFATLGDLADYAFSMITLPNGFEIASYTINMGSITFVSPSSSTFVYYYPECSVLGYPPAIVASLSDIQSLLGACASLFAVAFAFRLARKVLLK